MTTRPTWQLEGATRDAKSVTSDWVSVGAPDILGVKLLEARWVIKSNGRLTEVFRRDWLGAEAHVDHVFNVVLNGHAVSAWHVHERTTDRLFVAAGHARVVLYDARGDAPTYGRVVEFLLAEQRPQLVVVPPGVWHGVQNLDGTPAMILNLPDRAYDYDNPDHWRLPSTTREIPHTFQVTAMTVPSGPSI